MVPGVLGCFLLAASVSATMTTPDAAFSSWASSMSEDVPEMSSFLDLGSGTGQEASVHMTAAEGVELYSTVQRAVHEVVMEDHIDKVRTRSRMTMGNRPKKPLNEIKATILSFAKNAKEVFFSLFNCNRCQLSTGESGISLITGAHRPGGIF